MPAPYRHRGAWASGRWWSRPAALRAARATVVVPGLFALSYKGFGNLQIALFAAFGSFATLVLVTFAGTWRDKLIAHAGLALAGSVLLVIGTVVSPSTAAAAIVTLPVTFLVFFAGVAGPNAATGVTGALLAYVLPAASPGTVGMIPDRLAGWWLASIAGTIAVLAFPTPSTGDRVRAAVTKLADALSGVLEAMVRGEPTDALLQAGIEAKHQLRNTFTGTPFRPTGLALRDQALANAIELLEWCTTLVVDGARERTDLRDAPAAERDLLGATASVLRQAGGLFTGATRAPDLDRLDELRRASLARIRAMAPGSDGFESDTRLSFHAHGISMAVLGIGTDALMAAQLVGPAWIAEKRVRWFDGETLGLSVRLPALARYSRAIAQHASLRSVWFINSLRGAVALAGAVAVADLTSVQHGFWVVLGTLSVLRTNASATGATAVRALLGTVLGFVTGGALLLAIGTSTAALWVTLPVAVLIASYSPGTLPFTVGQAAFTITVGVLFNLLVPVGWKVGELRVEDVALGCAVSVVVGMLFWPRGVASVVGDDLADAYRWGARYLREAVRWACGLGGEAPQAADAALTAGLRLDEAVRGFLAEQGTKHLTKEELWRLIGGTLRLRLTAHAIAELPRDCAQTAAVEREALAERAEDLCAWYGELATLVGRSRAGSNGAAAPQARLTWGGDGASPASRPAVWLGEHLDHLADHLSALVAPAAHVSEVRRGPWWR